VMEGKAEEKHRNVRPFEREKSNAEWPRQARKKQKRMNSINREGVEESLLVKKKFRKSSLRKKRGKMGKKLRRETHREKKRGGDLEKCRTALPGQGD